MLKIKNASVKYGSLMALDNVSLSIDNGERVAVCGINGAGKSTLLKALLDAAPKKNERCEPSVVFVPQELPMELDETLNAHDYVMLGRTPHLNAWRMPSAADEAAVLCALKDVGLGEDASRRLGAFSGGERRRLALALALASGASTLLLDESMAHLDVKHRVQMFQLLADSGKTIVMSLHEFPLPKNFFTRAILMENGRIIVDGAPTTVVEHLFK